MCMCVCMHVWVWVVVCGLRVNVHVCVHACVGVGLHVNVHVCVHARGLGIVLDSQASYSRDGKACNSVSGCGLV